MAMSDEERISIHAPLAGCDSPPTARSGRGRYFNPRTPCGVRLPIHLDGRRRADFNPRTPCGVRHCGCPDVVRKHGNFNPRTPCGVRLYNDKTLTASIQISIHAPLAGCDLARTYHLISLIISIHAPLAGCDYNQSCVQWVEGDFNPRTPCGVRHIADFAVNDAAVFQSTHPLRGATLRSTWRSAG